MTERAIRCPGPLAALVGLALAATAALPVVAGEASVLELIREAFAEKWANGILVTLLVGAPYLLGLTVAAAAVLRSTLGLLLMRVPVAVLYAELVVMSLFIASEPGELVAPWSLVGFTAVATLSAIVRVSGERRRGSIPDAAWLGRWGATLVAALYGWLLLQARLPPSIAPGLWATTIAAALLAAFSRATASRSA